jgi:hypothetical protein
MLIRDNKFDEFTLADIISKINLNSIRVFTNPSISKAVVVQERIIELHVRTRKKAKPRFDSTV